MKQLIVMLLLTIATPALRAQEELPDAKAATEIIESLQGTLGEPQHGSQPSAGEAGGLGPGPGGRPRLRPVKRRLERRT